MIPEEIDRKAIEAGAQPECDCDECLSIYEKILAEQGSH
jgi:hypothetical protein